MIQSPYKQAGGSKLERMDSWQQKSERKKDATLLILNMEEAMSQGLKWPLEAGETRKWVLRSPGGMLHFTLSSLYTFSDQTKADHEDEDSFEQKK